MVAPRHCQPLVGTLWVSLHSFTEQLGILVRGTEYDKVGSRQKPGKPILRVLLSWSDLSCFVCWHTTQLLTLSETIGLFNSPLYVFTSDIDLVILVIKFVFKMFSFPAIKYSRPCLTGGYSRSSSILSEFRQTQQSPGSQWGSRPCSGSRSRAPSRR